MSSQPRHAARTQEWPALPAGRAPLPLGMAPAAERRSVRPPRKYRLRHAVFLSALWVAGCAPGICRDELSRADRESAKNTLAYFEKSLSIDLSEIPTSLFAPGSAVISFKIVNSGQTPARICLGENTHVIVRGPRRYQANDASIVVQQQISAPFKISDHEVCRGPRVVLGPGESREFSEVSTLGTSEGEGEVELHVNILSSFCTCYGCFGVTKKSRSPILLKPAA